MTKQSSLKKPKANPEKTVSSPVKPSATANRKKHTDEIDEIFSGKKRKQPDQQKGNTQWKSDAQDGNEPGKLKLKLSKEKKKKRGSVDTEPPARPRRKTADGLTLYTEEELGVDNANAGGTSLCPFDCNCCF